MDNNGNVDAAADMAALKKLLLEGKVAINADINGDSALDIRDLIRFKKIAADVEVNLDVPFENYTYAFSAADALSVDGIQSVTYKPYCIVDGLKMYGEEYTPVYPELDSQSAPAASAAQTIPKE